MTLRRHWEAVFKALFPTRNVDRHKRREVSKAGGASENIRLALSGVFR